MVNRTILATKGRPEELHALLTHYFLFMKSRYSLSSAIPRRYFPVLVQCHNAFGNAIENRLKQLLVFHLLCPLVFFGTSGVESVEPLKSLVVKICRQMRTCPLPLSSGKELFAASIPVSFGGMPEPGLAQARLYFSIAAKSGPSNGLWPASILRKLGIDVGQSQGLGLSAPHPLHRWFMVRANTRSRRQWYFQGTATSINCLGTGDLQRGSLLMTAINNVTILKFLNGLQEKETGAGKESDQPSGIKQRIGN
jgi:hypothetical protein